MTSAATVFVVDDDQLSRKSICALVQSMGIRTQAFASAAEILETAEAGCEGCLITDVCMADMTGLQLQQELRRRNIHLPVIVITGVTDPSLNDLALEQGAVAVLDKPCDDRRLSEVLDETLGRPSQ